MNVSLPYVKAVHKKDTWTVDSYVISCCHWQRNLRRDILTFAILTINTEALVIASKVIGLEANAEKTTSQVYDHVSKS